MSLKSSLILGAAGAAAIFASRKFKLPVAHGLVDGPASGMQIASPLPNIGNPGNFGYEWAIVPAAIGWYLSR